MRKYSINELEECLLFVLANDFQMSELETGIGHSYRTSKSCLTLTESFILLIASEKVFHVFYFSSF